MNTARFRYVHVGQLELAVPTRKTGLREAYMKAGKLVQINGKPFIQVPDADYQQIRKAYPPLAAMISAKTGKAPPFPKPSTAVAMLKPLRPHIAVNPPRKPGPIQLARNAAAAAGRVIVAAAKNQPIQATNEVFQSRIKVCSTCEFSDKAQNPRCSVCGCYLASQIIGKARLETEQCPKDKWPA